MGKVNQMEKKTAGSGRLLNVRDGDQEDQIRRKINRRGFFKFLGLRALGLGFGVSIFDTIFQSGAASAGGGKSRRRYATPAHHDRHGRFYGV